MTNLKIIQKEIDGCLKFFENATSAEGVAFGLTLDKYPTKNYSASIAASGFMLAGQIIAVELGSKIREKAEDFCFKVITELSKLERYHGFFYHFYDCRTGEILNEHTEVSTIDTALLIAGAVTAGEYFGGRVKEVADKLYADVEFEHFGDKVRKQIIMSYRKTKGYSANNWDLYAEQLILYVLAAGAPNPKYRLGREYYQNMGKQVGRYGEHEYIFSWTGSLFTHQFSHAFVDFRRTQDYGGTDWFANSVTASKASRQYCIDNPNNYKMYDSNSWGLSSSAGPQGYQGRYGTPPSGNNDTEHRDDGTIALYAAPSSIVFTPDESIAALKNFYKNKTLIGEYGLYAAFNKNVDWVGEHYLGIDKGITLLMLANYLNGCVWKAFAKSEYVKNGLKEIGKKKIQEQH